MRVLVIDNYDSFTYNLVQLIGQCGDFVVDVMKNDQVTPERAGAYDKILISPGPGLPTDAGNVCAIIRELAPQSSILGICLGHQAIAEVFGASLIQLEEPLHGRTLETQIDRSARVFAGLPERFLTVQYHSWTVDPSTLTDALHLIAHRHGGQIMGLRHIHYDVTGLQFHPESYKTEYGKEMMQNWLVG